MLRGLRSCGVVLDGELVGRSGLAMGAVVERAFTAVLKVVLEVSFRPIHDLVCVAVADTVLKVAFELSLAVVFEMVHDVVFHVVLVVGSPPPCHGPTGLDPSTRHASTLTLLGLLHTFRHPRLCVT